MHRDRSRWHNNANDIVCGARGENNTEPYPCKPCATAAKPESHHLSYAASGSPGKKPAISVCVKLVEFIQWHYLLLHNQHQNVRAGSGTLYSATRV